MKRCSPWWWLVLFVCLVHARAVPAQATSNKAAPSSTSASVSAAAPHASGVGASGGATKARKLSLKNQHWVGDFDGMVQRRVVRVAIPYSRTLYYTDKGRERGITAEHMRDFERYVNRRYAKELGKRPITFYLIPTTRDELLTDLVQGQADIAAGNLTITPERRAQVDFVVQDPNLSTNEVVVSTSQWPALADAMALSGRKVHTRKSSSYHASLVSLNEQLVKAGRPPVQLVLVPDALEDEDMLDMVNAGVIEAIVMDDWKAQAWTKVLPKVQVHDAAVVRSGGQVGWAVRKGSPRLNQEIADFFEQHLRKNKLITYRVTQFTKRVKQLKNPGQGADWQRFEKTIALFRKYGATYGFDPLMLAAQGYQESTLDQNARSHVGAIGIMQIMPATGAELRVGDIRLPEANVHAGTKYMDQLMTRYFKDANFNENNRSLFAFASYNAGPGRISSMRQLAKERGLDPNQWFNHVELVTAEKVGIETTTYVRNIYKYYVAYSLTLDLEQTRSRAKADLMDAASAPAK